MAKASKPQPEPKKTPPLNPIDKLRVEWVGLLEWSIKNKLSDTDIAFSTHIPVEDVRKSKKAMGIGPRDRLEEVGLDEGTLRRIYVVDGWTLEQIAFKYNCGLATVRRGMMRWSIPIQSSGARKQVKIEDIKIMVDAGKDCIQIANELKVSKASVMRVVRQQLDMDTMTHLLWLDGITEEQLAKRLGVPVDPLKRFIKTKMGMARVYWSLASERRPNYLKELYSTDKHGRKYTVAEIAKMFHLDVRRLSKFLGVGEGAGKK